MRFLTMILFFVFCLTPAFAGLDLKGVYLESCQNKYKKSAEFCQCSYEAFVSHEDGNANLGAVDFDKYRQNLRKRIKHSEDVLFSDPAVSSAYIEKICRMHDDLFEYMGKPSGKLYMKYKAVHVQKPMTVEEKKQSILKIAAMRKGIRDYLTKHVVSPRSFSELSSGGICTSKRALKQLNEDEQKASGTLTKREIAILTAGGSGYGTVVRAGILAECTE